MVRNAWKTLCYPPLPPKKNSVVFKKIANPAFDFQFWMLYFVPSPLFPICVECNKINVIGTFFSFFYSIFWKHTHFQEDYRIMERRKKNKVAYWISHLNDFLKLRTFCRKVGKVWRVFRFFFLCHSNFGEFRTKKENVLEGKSEVICTCSVAFSNKTLARKRKTFGIKKVKNNPFLKCNENVTFKWSGNSDFSNCLKI